MSEDKMITFIACDGNSSYLNDLEYLFQTEWSDFRFSETHMPNSMLPPVIAVFAEDVMIGGLAYCYYPAPHQVQDVIWINAVYVSQQWRGKGIASQLLRMGTKQVSNHIQSTLYAYTKKPQLYQSLGWSVIETESKGEQEHFVMSIEL